MLQVSKTPNSGDLAATWLRNCPIEAATGTLTFMIDPRPITLQSHGVRLEPLERSHSDALHAATADGELWKLWYVATADLAPGTDFLYVDAAVGCT
jgi:hypothetical protein